MVTIGFAILQIPFFHDAVDLALRIAFGAALTLVVKLLALAETKLDLDPAVLEIERQRNQGDAILHDAGLELDNLTLVHQQTPRPYRVTVKDVAVFVGADMHTADKQLAVLDGTEAVLQVDLAGTDRLDLGTGKLNPRLKALEHEIFMKRLTVVGDLFYAKLLRQGASPLSTAS